MGDGSVPSPLDRSGEWACGRSRDESRARRRHRPHVRPGIVCRPHISVGLVCGDGDAALLPLLVPLLRAKELLFTGDRVGPDAAVELGLANRVIDHDDLHSEAVALAHRIAAQPRSALRETKRAIQLGVEHALDGVVAAAARAELESMASEERAALINSMIRRSESRDDNG